MTIRAFSGLRFSACTGQFTILVGASGSGKSSALKCIYRTYLADEGQILYTDATGTTVDLARAAEETILAYRQREIRMVSQFLHVLPRQTAVDVVARVLVPPGGSLDRSRGEARPMLQQLGLPERLWNVPPFTFSGGERQLVNLARTGPAAPVAALGRADGQPRPGLGGADRVGHGRTQGAGRGHGRRLPQPGIVDRLADFRIELTGGVVWHDAVAPSPADLTLLNQ